LFAPSVCSCLLPPLSILHSGVIVTMTPKKTKRRDEN